MYPQANSASYHRYKNWHDTLIQKFKVFKLHPMAAAHEVALVTKLIGAITKVEVNPTLSSRVRGNEMGAHQVRKAIAGAHRARPLF